MGIEELLMDQYEKKGRKEGHEEGKNEEKKVTALKMKENDLDVILISNITGLSVEEINNLR